MHRHCNGSLFHAAPETVGDGRPEESGLRGPNSPITVKRPNCLLDLRVSHPFKYSTWRRRPCCAHTGVFRFTRTAIGWDVCTQVCSALLELPLGGMCAYRCGLLYPNGHWVGCVHTGVVCFTRTAIRWDVCTQVCSALLELPLGGMCAHRCVLLYSNCRWVGCVHTGVFCFTRTAIGWDVCIQVCLLYSNCHSVGCVHTGVFCFTRTPIGWDVCIQVCSALPELPLGGIYAYRRGLLSARVCTNRHILH